MNRKQKAMEERFKGPASKYANPLKNTNARKMYEPSAEVRLVRRKRSKLAELLKCSNSDNEYYNDYKREAEYLLEECAGFKTLDEWNKAKHNNGFFFLFGQAQQALPSPTKCMKLTWDVHTGVALTKLYNSLY